MIIDAEVHVIFRLAFREGNPDKPFYERYTWHEHSGDLLVSEMDRAGVDQAFLISYGADDLRLFIENWGWSFEDFMTGRKYTLSFVRKYPNRFYWFACCPDPRREDALERLGTDFKEGAVGIKVFPAMLGMNLNDPALMRVFEFCREEGRLVMIGVEEATPPKTPSLDDFLHALDEEVLPQFPDMLFQVNHAGCHDPLGPEAQICFDIGKRHDNILYNTSILGYCWDDEHEYPFPNQMARLEKLYDEVGVDKLIWATDWPWTEHVRMYAQDVDAVRKHCHFMTDDEKETFMYRNAIRYLGPHANAR